MTHNNYRLQKHLDKRGYVWFRRPVRLRRLALLPAFAFAVSVGSAACGDNSHGRPAVRVGNVAIDRATVDHWARVVTFGSALPMTPGGTPRDRALSFLISAHWLVREADERGLAVSEEAVERRLRERVASTAEDRSEFERELSSLHQTEFDVKLEIKAELAASKLSAMVSRQARPATQADLVGYYDRHRGEFRIPQSRVTDLIEGIATRAAAIDLRKQIGPGKRFVRRALHEHVERRSPREASRTGNRELVHAIFTAPLGVVAGPVRFGSGWVLFVVRHEDPSRAEPLSDVRERIARRLADERRRHALLRFLADYRTKWTARTNCAAGFVVQKCSQYHGPLKAEGNPLSGH